MPNLQPGATYDPVDMDAFRKFVIGGLDPMNTGAMDPRGWSDPSTLAQAAGGSALGLAGPKGAALGEAALHLLPNMRSPWQGIHHMKFINDLGKHVGDVTLTHNPAAPQRLNLDYITNFGGGGPLGGRPNSMGTRDMMSLLQSVKEHFPEAESIVGHSRISGASAASEHGYGYKPLSLKRVKPLSEEQKKVRDEALRLHMEELHGGLGRPSRAQEIADAVMGREPTESDLLARGRMSPLEQELEVQRQRETIAHPTPPIGSASAQRRHQIEPGQDLDALMARLRAASGEPPF